MWRWAHPATQWISSPPPDGWGATHGAARPLIVTHSPRRAAPENAQRPFGSADADDRAYRWPLGASSTPAGAPFATRVSQEGHPGPADVIASAVMSSPTSPRNRGPLDRVGRRAAGRRRVTGATAWSAAGGAALAVAFGTVFAQGAAAQAAPVADPAPLQGFAPAAIQLAPAAAEQTTTPEPATAAHSGTIHTSAPAEPTGAPATTAAPQPPAEAPAAAADSDPADSAPDASSGGS